MCIIPVSCSIFIMKNAMSSFLLICYCSFFMILLKVTVVRIRICAKYILLNHNYPQNVLLVYEVLFSILTRNERKK